MKQIASILALVSTLALLGCASTTPTAFERTFADVQTNYYPKVVVQTNIMTLTNTVVQTITNEVGVPVARTNFTEIQVPVPVLVTNMIPIYYMTPNATAQAVAGAAGTVSNLGVPGIGGLVGSGVLGLLSIWFGIRNRQFKGQNDVLTQSAGVLAQIIETGREVMAKTPQGQQAANAFTAWMVSHQNETNTIAEISQLVKDSVKNEEAQKAATQILALINQPPKT